MEGLEVRAEKTLRKSGLEVFLPRECQWRGVRALRRRAAEVAYPRFPGYLFALLNPLRWPDTRNWPFIRGVITFSGRPVPLAAGEIERLKAEDGTTVPHVCSVPMRRALVPGQTARIRTGPFRDFVVVIESIDEGGARMTVPILGRPTRMVQPIDQLEAA